MAINGNRFGSSYSEQETRYHTLSFEGHIHLIDGRLKPKVSSALLVGAEMLNAARGLPSVLLQGMPWVAGVWVLHEICPPGMCRRWGIPLDIAEYEELRALWCGPVW
ncbi:hypothetical protein AAG570_013389 [Ranatra chinensis]|uniref:Uncharacterized protein n=1 Tax=Ranatra chinensis TaxID=642074 RepID=A0ABD0YC14_9HEMI